MENLAAQPLSLEMRDTDELYVYLARILQKIHGGSPLPTTRDLFGEIQQADYISARLSVYGHSSGCS